MRPLVTFADPEASARTALLAGLEGRVEAYIPASITNKFPTAALTGDATHLQVELDGVPGADYPVTERATVRVTAYSAPGSPSNAKSLATLAQGLLYVYGGDSDVHGFQPLTGRLKAVDPATGNNLVSFTMRADMVAHVL